jgi:hypothetical protein
VKNEIRQVGGGEQEVGPERHGLAREPHVEVHHADALGEPPVLVILAVIGEERLWRDTEDPAARDDDAAVVEAAVAAHRRAHDEDGPERLRCCDELGDAGFHAVEESVLEQEVVYGIGADPELGEEHEVGFARVPFAHEHQRLGAVRFGVPHLDPGGAGGDSHEPLAVEGEKPVFARHCRCLRRKSRGTAPKPAASASSK